MTFLFILFRLFLYSLVCIAFIVKRSRPFCRGRYTKLFCNCNYNCKEIPVSPFKIFQIWGRLSVGRQNLFSNTESLETDMRPRLWSYGLETRPTRWKNASIPRRSRPRLQSCTIKLSQHKSTRGHSLKLFYPDSRINNVRANFFSVRVISLWHRLPADLVQDNNLIKFKSMLRTVNFSFALIGKI